MTQPLGPQKPPNADQSFGSMGRTLNSTVPKSLLRAKQSILHMRRRRKRF